MHGFVVWRVIGQATTLVH